MKAEKENLNKENLNKENLEKASLIDYGIFALLLLVTLAVTFALFYRQCVESMLASGLYHSDMKAYILEMQGLDSGYSFPYPILFKTAAFFHLFTGPEAAMAIATTLLNGLGILVTKLALNRLALKELAGRFSGREWIAGALLSLTAVSLFFISMVYPPAGIYLPGIKYNYLGVFTANPFHNATYMAARPFAILAFLWYVRLLDTYEQGGDKKDYILFAIFLLLATMTKPSFTIVLVGAAGLIMLYRLFRSGFKSLKNTVLLGLTFIPTFADLLYQFKGVFVPAEGAEGGIGFCLGDIWRLYCDNIPLAVGLAVGFPILVLVLNYRELQNDTLYRFSWQIYLMSFAMAFLLYEKGFRAPDFNFSWGYMYGIFFAFLGSVTVLWRATAAGKRPLLLGIQWLAFAWHLLSGLYYFYGILQGKMYY
ncbi:MAG: hypothetical protein NC092_04005 [Butyrivibrio sp.]|nr:hypothetical protein [Muribaculum sp.]MCM1551838.1 hypothetical protein [Butyrivibrio sp.]